MAQLSSLGQNEGGIFLHPGTSTHLSGQLRLLYECNPMAFPLDAAGGMALDGFERSLDVKPTTLYQRSAAVFGSAALVKRYFQPSFVY